MEMLNDVPFDNNLPMLFLGEVSLNQCLFLLR
jgi:hypothetical protein